MWVSGGYSGVREESASDGRILEGGQQESTGKTWCKTRALAERSLRVNKEEKRTGSDSRKGVGRCKGKGRSAVIIVDVVIKNYLSRRREIGGLSEGKE